MSAATASEQSEPPEVGISDARRVSRTFGLVVVLTAVVTSVASFLILTGQTAIEPTPAVVRAAGIGNGLIVLLLIGIVAYEASGLWVARRRGRAAARLHIRIVLLFSFIAALPAILMVIIASVTLNKGLDRWFSARTEAIIDTSRAVAQAYVAEHSRMLGLDLLAIAGEFNRVTPDIDADQSAIASYLTNQARLRGLSTVQLIRKDRSLIVQGETTSNIPAPPAPEEIFAKLDSGEPALIAPGTTNLVGGVIKLTGFDDLYLYLARPIDPRVTRNLRLTEENAAEYRRLQENRSESRSPSASSSPVWRWSFSSRRFGSVELCEQHRLADPEVDWRRQGDRRRQSRCPRARPRLHRRPRALGDELQHDDEPG